MAACGYWSTGPIDRQSIGKLAVGLGRPAAKEKNFSLFCRSTGPVDRQNPRAKGFQSVDRSGRPTDVHKRARPDHKARSTGPVDRSGLKWTGRPARSTDRLDTRFL